MHNNYDAWMQHLDAVIAESILQPRLTTDEDILYFMRQLGQATGQATCNLTFS